MDPVYAFIDESGNLDFDGTGTDHFVMSAFVTTDPMICGRGPMSLKYEFLTSAAHDQIPFHAVNNTSGTRKRFIKSLCQRKSPDHSCAVHTVFCDKHYAHQSKHKPEVFYALIGGAMAKYFAKVFAGKYSPVVLVFDAALSAKQRSAFLKVVKPVMNTIGTPYQIMFAPVKEEPCGQIADYYAWATFRRLESNDRTWIDQMPLRPSEFNIFQNGHTRYW